MNVHTKATGNTAPKYKQKRNEMSQKGLCPLHNRQENETEHGKKPELIIGFFFEFKYNLAIANLLKS